jgi:hypothetical protein
MTDRYKDDELTELDPKTLFGKSAAERKELERKVKEAKKRKKNFKHLLH